MSDTKKVKDMGSEQEVVEEKTQELPQYFNITLEDEVSGDKIYSEVAAFEIKGNLLFLVNGDKTVILPLENYDAVVVEAIYKGGE